MSEVLSTAATTWLTGVPVVELLFRYRGGTRGKPSTITHIRYPGVGWDGSISVATTRVETMLGDTAVAVHPEDERYRHLVGKKVLLPLVNREIPIIADEYVDPAFGSGAVKITPAHDPNDFEIGQRHGLETISVIGGDGRMTPETGKYAGLDRYEARRKFSGTCRSFPWWRKLRIMNMP